jgi:hypothetical protein
VSRSIKAQKEKKKSLLGQFIINPVRTTKTKYFSIVINLQKTIENNGKLQQQTTATTKTVIEITTTIMIIVIINNNSSKNNDNNIK